MCALWFRRFVVLAVAFAFVPFEPVVPVSAQVSIIPIGTVQGVVSDTVNGRTFRSPFAPPTGNGAGQTVRIQGVIYEKTLARTSSGGSQFGFFIQNTAATADGNANTSDGIFVFMGGFATILPLDSGRPVHTPQVGDEIILQGRVTEFFSLTEITSPRWVCASDPCKSTVRTGVDIDVEIPPFAVNPPDDFADAGRYWERREGMRALVPANSLVVGRREVFTSNLDSEVWVIRSGHPLARRREAYEQRVFRDPHPLDDIPEILFDNGNGFRIVMGGLGIKAVANDNRALIAPARTFDHLKSAVFGGVYFSFNKYQIMVERQLELHAGPDPSRNAPVPGYDPSAEVRIATFNVENLYDFRDDSADGCDFAGNPGCPGVNPPFDYVPESQAAYQEKLNDLARQIVTDLGAPDIILIQEAEDQDICGVAGTVMVCGESDGRPDTVQELALVVASIGGPVYDAANDRDGADDRGIVNAYLFRKGRVELLSVKPSHPVLGRKPKVDYPTAPLDYNADVENPKVLNAVLPVDALPGADGSNVFTRPPQVGLFRIRVSGAHGASADLYILNNHFSSTPNARVAQRREQAAYNAAIVAALQRADPQVRVIVAGDLNVFPRPDDPFAPGETFFPSDQLRALYDLGMLNLWDTLLAQSAAAAYSYVFEGQAQTLDQLFLTPSLMTNLIRVWAAHVNSDWPQDHAGDGPRGASDHDPQGADFEFAGE